MHWDYDMILGTDLLRKLGIVVDFRAARAYRNSGAEEMPLVLIDQEIDPRKPGIRVELCERTIVRAKTRRLVKVRLVADEDLSGQEGVLHPYHSIGGKRQVLSPRAVARVRDGNCITAIGSNLSNQDVSLAKQTFLGTWHAAKLEDPETAEAAAMRGEAELVVCTFEEEPEDPIARERYLASLAAERAERDARRARLRERIDLDYIRDPRQQERLLDLLEEFYVLFEETEQLGRTDKVYATVDTGSAAPIRTRPHRLSKAERDVVTKEVKKLLDLGLIRPSSSPWAAPVVLVPKKEPDTWRFTIDYRRLNSLLEDSASAFPMPRVDELLDCFAGSAYFSECDARHGYHQLPLRTEADMARTAFVTHDGLYEWVVLPQGLKTAPAIFSQLMSLVLAGLNWVICACFLDDIGVFSKTFDEHLVHLRQVFERLRDAKLQLSAVKEVQICVE
jgi:hypothetical protein